MYFPLLYGCPLPTDTLYCGLQKLKEKQPNIVNVLTRLPASCNPLCCGVQKPWWTPGPITG